ncbi:MAG: alpha/beta hydrolase [Pseudomonadota bacterium]|nr:alpha/beta hydrolase [Pseudomonadota bacterium]
MRLETVDIETAAQPSAAIIWLHGLGADGHDFEPIVPEILRPGERAWRFVFPHATAIPVTINGGMRMRAWYDVVGFDRRSAEDEAGFRASEAAIQDLIVRENQRGIGCDRIVLAGFSQGGAVALYTALRLKERMAGVMALSTYLPLASRLGAERAAANSGVPIFMAHGLADATLPMQLGIESRDLLRGVGYPVEWHQYPMAHAVCAEEISDIRAYLLRVLPVP